MTKIWMRTSSSKKWYKGGAVVANTTVVEATNNNELKKQSIINMIRSLLPIIGLVAVFIVFNVLTKGNMWTSRKLILNQVYVVLISAVGVFFIMSMGGLDFSQGSIMGLASSDAFTAETSLEAAITPKSILFIDMVLSSV